MSGLRRFVITIDDYGTKDETRLTLIKSVVDGLEEVKENSALLHRYDVLDQLAWNGCPLRTSKTIVDALFGKLIHPET